MNVLVISAGSNNLRRPTLKCGPWSTAIFIKSARGSWYKIQTQNLNRKGNGGGLVRSLPRTNVALVLSPELLDLEPMRFNSGSGTQSEGNWYKLRRFS